MSAERIDRARKQRAGLTSNIRDKLRSLTAEEFASLPAASLRALERRGLAHKRGQRWKLTGEGRLVRMIERDTSEETVQDA